MAARTAFAKLITRSSLKKLAGDKYFERGLDYFESGAVVHLDFGKDGISARVQGTEPCPYAVRFWLEEKELGWGCACPLGAEGAFCKHLVATRLAWLSGETIEDDRATPEDLEMIKDVLDAIDEQTLIELLSQRALWDESLAAELMLAARAHRHHKPGNQTQAKNRPVSRKSTDSTATKRPK